MKRLKFYRAIVAIAMMLIGWMPSLAHDFEANGVFYNKTSDNTVAVTYKGNSYNSYDDEYLGNIVIPSSVNYNGTTYSVTSIGDNAFSGCESLTSIVWNAIKCSDLSSDYCPFRYCSNITSFTFGDEVEHIPAYLCYYMSNLTSIEIPNSITSIGEWAFAGCSSLTSIEIPNSVTSFGNYVFSGCSSLTSIEIPNSVTSFGNYVFSGCSSLTSVVIGNSVTSIGDNAFSGCESLTSIVIGNSVTSIGEWAFNGCDSLTSIVVDTGNTKYDSRNGCNAIIETASNTLIAGCQNTIIPNSVTSIGWRAFYGCSSLTSIEIPNGVTSIGDYAFYDCSSLTSIEIPNSVTSIGGSAFFWCDSLTSVVIGNSVTSIGDNAFSGCDSMTSVVIGNCVTSIGWRAFKDCSSLSEITCWATTPPTIEPDTFSNYSAELYVPTGCKSAYRRTAYWRKFNISDTLDAPVTLNGNDVIVATIGENIVVKNAKLGSNVRVYATDGSIITSEIATDGDVVVKAPVKGIYIVAVDSKTFKVMVK